MRKKLKRVVVLFVGYWFTSLFLAILMTYFSVIALSHRQWQLERYTAIVARAGLLPITLLFTPFQLPTLLAWNEGLILLQNFHLVATPAETLWEQYQQGGKLDSQMLKQLSRNTTTLHADFTRFSQLTQKSSLLKRFEKHESLYTQLTHNSELTPFFQFADLFLQVVSSSLMSGKDQRFLILFQNNMELRPTGGFPGSYGVLSLAKDKPFEFQVEDIYVPDGQLEGHVDPPLPIQEAFQQGFWKLRDANWHPDFPSSARLVEWFFKEGTNQEFDGVIAINFSIVDALLQVTGPISVPDYDQTISSENVYQFLQRTDDKSFFAGSTKKRDVLNAFARQLLIKMNALSPAEKLRLLDALSQEFKKKNILVSLHQPDLNGFAAIHNWDGSLSSPSCTDAGCEYDYFSMFEANLGVNKSNCCVKRNVEITKTSTGSHLLSTVTVTYDNPPPTAQYTSVSGYYKAFVRLYYPASTTVEPITIQGKSVSEYITETTSQGLLHPITQPGYSVAEVSGLKEIGFWIVVPVGQTLEVIVKTNSEINPTKPFHLLIQKQPGTQDFFNQFSVTKDSETLFSDTLQTDLRLY